MRRPVRYALLLLVVCVSMLACDDTSVAVGVAVPVGGGWYGPYGGSVIVGGGPVIYR
jgi:hypothetical protein